MMLHNLKADKAIRKYMEVYKWKHEPGYKPNSLPSSILSGIPLAAAMGGSKKVAKAEKKEKVEKDHHEKNDHTTKSSEKAYKTGEKAQKDPEGEHKKLPKDIPSLPIKI
jgi:hypothetical protein